MVIKKRKKVNKYRGHTTHGGGHRKKRRGAGSRGGRGRAGTGKRAGQKKAGIAPCLGAKGFTSRKKKFKAISVGFFNKDKVNVLVNKGKIKENQGTYEINLKQLGYDKLLGAGKVDLKLRIVVNSYVPKAEEKVKAAGGEIIVNNKKSDDKPVKKVSTDEPDSVGK